jgi:hypothetical protein
MTDRVDIEAVETLTLTARRPSFRSPFVSSSEGVDLRDRVGQTFEIVGLDASAELLDEGGAGPLIRIRFPDAVEIWARSEEVFSDEEVFVNGEAWPA